LTEPQVHLDIAMQFKDTPLLIEKPLACNYNDARKIQDNCCNLFHGFQARYNKKIKSQKHMFKNAKKASAEIHAPRGNHYFAREWRKELSPMMHHGIHAVDFFIWWFGEVIHCQKQDNCLYMEHINGTKSSVIVTRNAPNLIDLKVYREDMVFKLDTFGKHFDMCKDFVDQTATKFDGTAAIKVINSVGW